MRPKNNEPFYYLGPGKTIYAAIWTKERAQEFLQRSAADGIFLEYEDAVKYRQEKYGKRKGGVR